MPCNIDPTPHEGRLYSRIDDAEARAAMLEACLCATMRFLETKYENPVAYLDMKEAGVAPEILEKWFVEHKEKDRIRKEAEKRRELAAAREAKRIAARRLEEKRLRALKKEALAKLTPEECRVLGIKVRGKK